MTESAGYTGDLATAFVEKARADMLQVTMRADQERLKQAQALSTWESYFRIAAGDLELEWAKVVEIALAAWRTKQDAAAATLLEKRVTDAGILDIALGRGATRGLSIWPAFQYQVPGVLPKYVVDREVVFGFYSGAYLHGYSYLKEITYETLAQSVLVYDQAMAALTFDERKMVIDNTAKRLVEAHKRQGEDEALITKKSKSLKKETETDIKVEALDADIDALASKAAELELARLNVLRTLKELEIKSVDQAYDASQVEAEIIRQQLLAQKANLDVIETGIRALEIQAQIADAAYRLASVSVRKADLEADIGRIGLDTAEVEARKSILQSDIGRVAFETAEVDVRLAGIDSDIRRIGLDVAEVDVRKSGLNSDISRIGLETSEVAVKKTMLDADIARIDLDIAEVDVKKTMLESDIGRLEFDYQEVDVRKAALEADIGRLEFDAQEVPVKLAQTEADTARLVTQTANESLVVSELEVAKAETKAYQEETSLIAGKESLVTQRIEAAEFEISQTIPELAEVIEKEKEADLTSQESRNQHAVAEYENRALNFRERVKTSEALTKLETDNDIYEGKMILEHAKDTAALHIAGLTAQKKVYAGAEKAADIISNANIVSTLTHQIGPTP